MEAEQKFYTELLSQLRTNPLSFITSLPRELVLELLKYVSRKQYLACGPEQTVLINEEGKVFCFGENRNGQLGIGQNKPLILDITKNEFLEKEQQEIKSISCGQDLTIFVNKTGKVFASGYTIWRNESHRYLAKKPEDVVLLKNERIILTSCGEKHAIFLSENGEVFSCGDNFFYQLGQETTVRHLPPNKINALTGKKIIFVACGSSHSIFLDETGAVFFCGRIKSFESSKIMQMTSLANEKIVFASTGSSASHTILLNHKGEAFSFGENSEGQLGLGDKTAKQIPVKISALSNEKIIHATTGKESSIMLNDKGELIVFGSPYSKYSEDQNRKNTIVVAKYPFGYKIKLSDNKRFTEAACAKTYAVLLDQDGRIFIWGVSGLFVAGLFGAGVLSSNELIEPTLIPNFSLFTKTKEQQQGGMVDYYKKYLKYKKKYMSSRM